jgi:hypothetical protein
MHPNERSKARSRLAGIAALAILVASLMAPGAAGVTAEPTDMVLDWNLHAVSALSNASTATPPGAGQPPPVASLHLAMTQGAVYDAVNAIDGGHAPYLAGLPPAPASASKAAAAATAAHHVLVGLVPPLPQPVRDSLNALYAASLLEIADGPDKADGIAIGAAVAAAMLAERADDNRYGAFRFHTGTAPGEWRPTSGVNDPNAWVARVRPFTLTSTSQFRTAGPNALTSAEYAAEFNEVKELGALDSSSRSDEQTQLARFFSANPVVMLNRTLREVATERGPSITEDARLFVLSSMSGADALINCWDDKEHWSFWRPATAIAEAASDGNPATAAPATTWTPLFANPPYPDHPSGYNCVTSATMHAAEAYFRGDKVGAIKLTNADPLLTSPTREYKRFTAVVKDTIDARIYMGIHFRTPDEQGAWLGKKVAAWVEKHYFRPVD